jgi:hypothetical protein
MLRDSRCRVARGYGSPQIPAAAQGAIQSNQIRGDRRLTLYELIFVRVKIALCIQHRQKIDETCFVLLGREIYRQLAVCYRIVQPVAALLFSRIADQRVLDLFERGENGGLIADQRLSLGGYAENARQAAFRFYEFEERRRCRSNRKLCHRERWINKAGCLADPTPWPFNGRLISLVIDPGPISHKRIFPCLFRPSNSFRLNSGNRVAFKGSWTKYVSSRLPSSSEGPSARPCFPSKLLFRELPCQ